MSSRATKAASGTLAAALLLLVVCFWPGHAAAQRLSFRAGLEYTTGEYGGTQDVEDVYVPLTLTYDQPRIGLRLTVPYLRVETAPGTTDSGLGDVIAGITIYDVLHSADGNLALDFTGKVKLGTADEAVGLGTGENDYSLQTDVYKYLARAMLSGTVGYKVRGDSAVLDLDDVWFVSLGGLYPFSASTQGGVFLDYRQSSIPGNESIRELSAFVSRQLSRRWRVQGYLIKGLSDASPDWGGGVALRTRF